MTQHLAQRCSKNVNGLKNLFLGHFNSIPKTFSRKNFVRRICPPVICCSNSIYTDYVYTQILRAITGGRQYLAFRWGSSGPRWEELTPVGSGRAGIAPTSAARASPAPPSLSCPGPSARFYPEPPPARHGGLLGLLRCSEGWGWGGCFQVTFRWGWGTLPLESCAQPEGRAPSLWNLGWHTNNYL